jgi:catechol 2,3-dioxygenase-like lactoylglutathione lyase family enzyme
MVARQREGACDGRVGKPVRSKASVYHIQINISDARKSFPFYEGFFGYLGYRKVDESPEHMGFSNGTTDFWIIQSAKAHTKRKFHRKSPGLNHISFGVGTPGTVRGFTRDFLKKRKIKILYGSPRSFPEYHKDYYAVYFEDPDRIKLELTCVPKKRSG